MAVSSRSDSVIHDTEYPTHGDPTVKGSKKRLVFDTTNVVDWRCPCCGEDGFVDLGRHAPAYAMCTGSGNDCPVYLFSVFRGEPDDE